MAKEASKRENEERADVLAQQTAIDSGKAVADITAEERFYNRSKKIRQKVMKWMLEHVDENFDSLGELEAQAANYAKCSMVTSRRWIFQFAQPGRPFYIEEKGDFYILRARD